MTGQIRGLNAALVIFDEAAQLRRCRVCGCTDTDACAPVDGWACRWVAEDLCSACIPARPRLGAPAVTWPIYTGYHELLDRDGLGLAIARAFRESA